MLHSSPCEPWPLDTSCCDLPEDTDPAVVERWQMVATQILWALSGRRWGPSCPVTVRPCRRACMDAYPMAVQWGTVGPWIPYQGADGLWRNASVCGCRSDCSCGELCEVRLEGPVHDIVEVLVDGEPLVPEAYRVDSANLLVRTDGECWPTCQDMAAPPDVPGTFAVTYRIGLPLDEAAIAAVSELTCHYVKGCGDTSCGCGMSRKNLTRLQRQGVTLEMSDPLGWGRTRALFYDDGRTGLPVADAWLSAVNPYRQMSPSRVYSPDFKRSRYTTWP